MNSLVNVGHRRRALVVLGLLAATLLMPTELLAASVSPTYSIEGYEYYATSTQGRFAGWATGSAGDTGVWNAVVDHTTLTDTAQITGGYARLATSNRVIVRGRFSDGSVTQVSEQPGCGDQAYAVVGALSHVTRSDSPRKGTGTFEATLTHFRALVFGRCQVYSARVTGTIALSF
jgi:hypothetical protein